MPQILPFQPSIPNYTVSVVLGTVEYVLQVRWNARDAAWYFDILDDTLDQIYSGIKVVLGTYLGARCSDPRWLAAGGILVATDTSNQGLDAGLDDLGARVQVVFYTVAEIDEVLATGSSSTPV